MCHGLGKNKMIYATLMNSKLFEQLIKFFKNNLEIKRQRIIIPARIKKSIEEKGSIIKIADKQNEWLTAAY